jgi:hypothetical protein
VILNVGRKKSETNSEKVHVNFFVIIAALVDELVFLLFFFFNFYLRLLYAEFIPVRQVSVSSVFFWDILFF